MPDDADLLRRYTDQRDEAAFAELVQRHVGLVFGTALRRVGRDAHLAEDVAQNVFTALARKAPRLTGRTSVAGWLHVTTRQEAAALIRRERRRKAREAASHLMDVTPAGEPHGANDPELHCRLDDALAKLPDAEREALALRFFARSSFAQIGATFHVSEDAARKRVDRALEKLRTHLGRHGFARTTAGIGLALAAAAGVEAPAGLSTRLSAQALTQAALPATGSMVAAALGAAWPAFVVLTLGGVALATASNDNLRLRAQLSDRSTLRQELASLRTENARLNAAVAEYRDLASALAVPRPAPVAAHVPPPPRPIGARINVSPKGTLDWNGEPVKLNEFVALLRLLQQNGDPAACLVVAGADAQFPALAYVIDEVRKAGIEHVRVESNAAADPKMGFSWF